MVVAEAVAVRKLARLVSPADVVAGVRSWAGELPVALLRAASLRVALPQAYAGMMAVDLRMIRDNKMVKVNEQNKKLLINLRSCSGVEVNVPTYLAGTRRLGATLQTIERSRQLLETNGRIGTEESFFTEKTFFIDGNQV